MLVLSYPATIESGDDEGFVVSFRDVPEAISQGETREEALAEASDALGLALLQYPGLGRPIPPASPARTDEQLVAPDATDSLKIAVLDAFRASGLSKSEFARRIGKGETEARRILDPMHRTKIGTIDEVLATLGRRIVIGFEDAA